MPLSREEMDRKMDEHYALEAADDIDGVVATLGENAVHDVVGWPLGATRGRDKAKAFYAQTFADLEGGAATSKWRLYGENFIVDESLWEGKAVGRPFGIDGNDRPLSFRILHVMEFDDAGAITRENVWLDMAAIMRQLGG